MSSKNPIGRPSKFQDLDMDKVIALVEKGFTDREIAMLFDIAPATWYSWQKEHPEFSELLQGWKKHANERVERSLYERAIGYEHHETKFFTYMGEVISSKTVIKHIPPEPGAAKLWLINRGEDWQDKKTEDLNIKGAMVLRWMEPGEKELPDWLQ